MAVDKFLRGLKCFPVISVNIVVPFPAMLTPNARLTGKARSFLLANRPMVSSGIISHLILIPHGDQISVNSLRQRRKNE
jgi:hypothetical protein